MNLTLFLLIVAVVVVALLVTASQNRRHTADTQPRLCRACGLSHPPFAAYCRRCGGKL